MNIEQITSNLFRCCYYEINCLSDLIEVGLSDSISDFNLTDSYRINEIRETVCLVYGYINALVWIIDNDKLQELKSKFSELVRICIEDFGMVFELEDLKLDNNI